MYTYINLFLGFRVDQRHHEKAKHVSEISDKFLFISITGDLAYRHAMAICTIATYQKHIEVLSINQI